MLFGEIIVLDIFRSFISFIFTIPCFSEYRPRKSVRCVHEYERSTTFQQQQNVKKYDQYTFLFLFSFIHLLAESVEILIILSQNLITTIFIVLKSSSYEESFLFAPSPMLESKQRTKYHINCEIGERLFHPMLAQDGKNKICVQSNFTGFQEL